MKRKLQVFAIVGLLFCIVLAFFEPVIAVILFLFEVIGILFAVLAFFCNKVLLQSNWLRNATIRCHSDQFISNFGYRDNIKRNFKVANLGSNPALFAFSWPDGFGLNWSTGSQGLELDFELLKYYHSYLAKGATVLIPIMPFTSVSQFIKTRKEYWGPLYYSNYPAILDWLQIQDYPYKKEVERLKKWPLLVYPSAWKYAFYDVGPDVSLFIVKSDIPDDKWNEDAQRWMNLWLEEFQVTSLNDFRSPEWGKYMEEARNIIKQMIAFCRDRGYRPILLTTPMLPVLRDLFSDEDWNYLVVDFVKSIDDVCVFKDYSRNEEYLTQELFLNSIFLSIEGRKKFTEKVIKDLM